MADNLGKYAWPGGRECAVSICYDGAWPEHLEIAHPHLSHLGLNATFYVQATRFLENPDSWQGLLQEGHEIGNHSLYGFTDSQGALHNWTLEMVEDDIRMTQKLLVESLRGNTGDSFAYPGPEPICAEGSYEPIVQRLFDIVKTCRFGQNNPAECELADLASVSANQSSADDLISLIAQAEKEGNWLLISFERIGVGEPSCDRETHDAVCDYLAEHPSSILVSPVSSVAQYVRESRSNLEPKT